MCMALGETGTSNFNMVGGAGMFSRLCYFHNHRSTKASKRTSRTDVTDKGRAKHFVTK